MIHIIPMLTNHLMTQWPLNGVLLSEFNLSCRDRNKGDPTEHLSIALQWQVGPNHIGSQSKVKSLFIKGLSP